MTKKLIVLIAFSSFITSGCYQPYSIPEVDTAKIQDCYDGKTVLCLSHHANAHYAIHAEAYENAYRLKTGKELTGRKP